MFEKRKGHRVAKEFAVVDVQRLHECFGLGPVPLEQFEVGKAGHTDHGLPAPLQGSGEKVPGIAGDVQAVRPAQDPYEIGNLMK